MEALLHSITTYNSLCFRVCTAMLLGVRILRHLWYMIPGPEVIKLFSCSAQLSMKFKLLVNIEIAKINGKFKFKSQKPVIFPADKCYYLANKC